MDKNFLINLYTSKQGEEVVAWNSEDYVGVSIIRDYPPDCGFLPPRTKQGNMDTKVLIKIGFRSAQIIDKTMLYVSASKYSIYLANHLNYNFDDDASPAKESIDASINSYQPVDIESRSFELDLANEIIRDIEKNKELTLSDVADYIFDLHVNIIKSLKGQILKSKIKAQMGGIKFLEKIKIESLKILEIFFGKRFIQTRDNWEEGLIKPYAYNSFSTVYPQSVPFFSSNIQIAKITIFWVALTACLLYIFWPAVRPINDIVEVAIIVLLVFLYDAIIPWTIIRFINQLIKFRKNLEYKKFKID